MRVGIVDLYCGQSGKKGYYNSQEIGLAKAMVRLKNECIIFRPDTECRSVLEEQIIEGVLLVSIPARKIGVHSRFKWKLLLKYQLDVLQLNSDNQIFAPELSRFCKQHKISQYHYLGTTGSDGATGIKAVLMGMLYQRNVRMLKTVPCFAKTQSVKGRLENAGIKNVILAPVGLDLSVIPTIEAKKNQLRSQMQLPNDRKLIVYVGRIEAYKHPLDAITLMRLLPEKYDMVMIGTGTMNSIVEQTIKTSEISGRIRRICQIPNKDIHKYYRAADYFVNFNPDEIFGMSILEAMWQGCTVIAHHAPGPDFILKDEKAGFLVNNLQEMHDIITSDRKTNCSYVQNYIEKNFTWEKTAKIMLEGMKV